MIKDYIERKKVEIIEYELCFDDGNNNGYGFPCDKNGNLDKNLNDAAKKNYEFCMQHPEKFERFNKVVAITRQYTEFAKGKCKCGNQIELINQYLGACECPYCGQWYNLWGQELLPPNEWNED